MIPFSFKTTRNIDTILYDSLRYIYVILLSRAICIQNIKGAQNCTIFLEAVIEIVSQVRFADKYFKPRKYNKIPVI